jgi:RNA polymerase sigma factor (sigma-70 family)
MHDREQVAALVRAAQTGDERAFAAIVAAFQDVAVAYATSVVRDYHLAEDATQEAFVDAYRALGSLREPAAFPSWFRRIVFKHCNRITRRKDHGLAPLVAALEVASPDPSALDALEQRETRHALRAAIATLTDAEQRAVLLFYMGDQSLASIADFLGVTANAVKTRLYSARRRLRAHMSDIEKRLDAARPSSDPRFAEAVRRMIQPEALKQQRPWEWSPGIGTDVWTMFCACMVGDLETVKALLAKDPSLVRSHYEYRTPLSFAVRENQLAVAELLLDRGAASVSLGDPIEMARDRGYTEMVALLERKMLAIYGASEAGEAVAERIRERDAKGMRRLLDEQPELIHAGDRRTSQPIHWATMTRQPALIDELLERGADINAARFDGARPIHLTNGDYHFRGWRDVPPGVPTHDEIYRHLVARGAYVDVWMAALKGDLDRVRRLIDEDPSLLNQNSETKTGYGGNGTPLANAASGGHMDVVKFLLDRGADPNVPQEHAAPHGAPLYKAVINGDYEMAKLLLEHGAHPNQPMESSADTVWIAIRDRNTRILELLGSYGAEWDIPNDLGLLLTYNRIVKTGLKRPMKILAYYDDLATATPLLEADPSLADDAEALTYAAERGHEKFVRLLLHYSPETAKRVLVAKPRAMAELLFAHGMDPDRPNWMRMTPLHHFAAHGDIEKAALYLDHGADIEAEDGEWRSTPLARAAEQGQKRMVEYLLRRGARVDPVGGPPWAKPIAWAERRGHTAVAAVLRDYAKTATLPVRTLAEYEQLVDDLVRAYAGDAASLDRIVEYFRIQRPLRWDRPPMEEQVSRFRRAVRARLDQPDVNVEASLSLDDARTLIARSEGFTDWADLESRSRARA